MDEWPCLEEEMDLNEATKKLVEAADALKYLPILKPGATPKERLEWQNELVEIKRRIQDTCKAFEEKSDALLKRKEEFAGYI